MSRQRGVTVGFEDRRCFVLIARAPILTVPRQPTIYRYRPRQRGGWERPSETVIAAAGASDTP